MIMPSAIHGQELFHRGFLLGYVGVGHHPELGARERGQVRPQKTHSLPFGSRMMSELSPWFLPR